MSDKSEISRPVVAASPTDEPTTVISGDTSRDESAGAAADEPTAVIAGGASRDEPAGAAADEPTAVISDAQPPDEAAAVIPGDGEPAATIDGAASDEPTVAMAGDAPADEPSTVIAAGVATDEPTTVIAGGVAAGESPTVIAGEVAPGEPTTVIAEGGASEERMTMISASAAPEESTVMFPASAAPEESTVMFRAGAAPDEPTEMFAAGSQPEEPTVMFAAGVPQAEGGVTRAPAEEPTVMISGGTPRDESTMMVAGGRPPADATMMTSGGAAAVPRPVAPPVTAPSGGFLTRRRLLLGLAGVTGTALAAAAVANGLSSDEETPEAAAPVSSAPATTRPRTPESVTVAPSALPVQARPIATLADYTKATGGPAFPSDAIALTIDDGPHPVWTPKILKLLDKHQIPALFCMIGNQVLGHENVARMVADSGHQLANHTWSHPLNLGDKAASVARHEIRRAQAKINKTTGQTPKLFRSPGGDWSPQLLKDVAKAGLLPLDWSNDPRDWARPGVASIKQRMLAATPGQILLCHDGGGDRSQTYAALSAVLPELKARGLRFVAL